ncbi:unnamed protein product [Caretta caretta]
MNETASDACNILKRSIYNATIKSFGKSTKKNVDWFVDHSEILLPLIEKKKSLITYRSTPTTDLLNNLKEACKVVQIASRRCAEEFWLDLCNSIQLVADTGDAGWLYEGIRKVIGPIKNMTAPLKDVDGNIITHKGRQLERWIDLVCSRLMCARQIAWV